MFDDSEEEDRLVSSRARGLTFILLISSAFLLFWVSFVFVFCLISCLESHNVVFSRQNVHFPNVVSSGLV